LIVKKLIPSIFCLFLACVVAAQGRAPLSFIENKGQWDPVVRYRADVDGGALFIHENGFTVQQRHPEDLAKMEHYLHARELSEKELSGKTLRSHVYRVTFRGANTAAIAVPDKAEQTITNYFIGNDPSKWGSNCRSFQGLTVRNLYPNIDLRYYSENGTLKYDLIVHPGGDPRQIVLQYAGTEGLSIREKTLEVKTSVGTVKEMPPYAYQYTEAGRQTVTCNYRLSDSTLGFQVRNYDPKSVLVIDPTVVFCSLSGSTANNWGFTATYGPDGSFFGGGIVFGAGFPVNTGAYQEGYGGGSFDIGIMRLTPNGSNRIYATFIGGSGSDQPHSLFSDPAGNLVITGRTTSAGSFPATRAYGPGGGNDIFVVKLNSTGSAIIGGTRIGGSGEDGVNITTDRRRLSLQYNYGDDGRSEVILDAAGNVYVASCTRSGDFHTQSGFQTALSGQQDAVVLKLSPNCDNLLFSTLLGGIADDAAYVLALNPLNGSLYVAGGTTSNNLPQTGGTLGATWRGDVDGFVATLTPGGALVRSTYVGTGAYDQIYGIQFDRLGFPYVMGQTLGAWPIINAQYSAGNARQFIAKLQPDLSAFVYSTTFGTPNASLPNISPTAFLVDRCENVYVSGWGGTASSFTSAGTLGLPVTPDAVNNPPYSSPSQTDGKDFYFFVLKKNATQQLFGSFFGENAAGGFPDHVDGGTSRFDANGVIYQAVCANCNNDPRPRFPTTPGSWSEGNPSSSCNMGMIKIALNLSGLSAGVQSAIGGIVRDTAGCLPLRVDFRDTVGNAVRYHWDFNGDGVNDQTTSTPEASHTYTALGTFRVRLVAVDSNSCNITDTSYLSIRVGELKATPSISFRKLNPCDSLRFQFTNTTVHPQGRPFRPDAFEWEFPDLNLRFRTGTGSFTQSFPRPGSYRVILRIVDTTFCNAPEEIDTILNVAVLVDAAVETPPNGCAPYDALFVNRTVGGQQFFWNFGNGTTSTDPSPGPVRYTNPGTYTISLVVVDSGTCNITDTARFTITLFGKPTAAIGAISPQPPTPNTAITFQNASQGAVRYKWLFGDGDSLLTNNQLPVRHEYNTSDEFEVLLIAYNAEGCPDTVRQRVRTLVQPAIDVPNAFTPLSGGINSVVFARGFGIATLRFTIWNRWGQKVFETTDRKTGWDGTFKGKLQPMDVYAYTLEVVFVDGKRATKRGDITLIR